MYYLVKCDHHDSWSVEDNYTDYIAFDIEKDAIDFVENKKRQRMETYTKCKTVPEYYVNYSYIGPSKYRSKKN